MNTLDHLIQRLNNKHNFNFKFVENRDFLKENSDFDVKAPSLQPEDIISRIKNKFFY